MHSESTTAAAYGELTNFGQICAEAGPFELPDLTGKPSPGHYSSRENHIGNGSPFARIKADYVEASVARERLMKTVLYDRTFTTKQGEIVP